MRKNLLIILLTVLYGTSVAAAELHIAVAANFSDSMRSIAGIFEKQTQHTLKISSGSSGKLYAQIKHGAPFDLFFAADSLRPELLEQERLAIAGSRFTYAIGQLILWSPQPDLVDPEGDVLRGDRFAHLAIANPRLAPYGEAARAVLQHKGVWKEIGHRMVRGENIAQTFQFVQSGNAELGFVALSQVGRSPERIHGSYWLIPSHLYPAIEQQAIIVHDSQVAREFMTFVKSNEITSLIRSHGYLLVTGGL
ncbi:MAG: molybdate ABC transporter substrate-binding protein [Gammaproteobacteria bacterium]|nr:molybdate ABC transporter substrate-binding protein [Gammaproteobacteria bacterium]